MARTLNYELNSGVEQVQDFSTKLGFDPPTSKFKLLCSCRISKPISTSLYVVSLRLKVLHSRTNNCLLPLTLNRPGFLESSTAGRGGFHFLV